MDDLGDQHGSHRGHKSVPIFIVEDHHEVVPFIHENIRKKFLPIEGITLIHLDSHPDMLIPKEMPADYAYDTRLLYNTHDIENWIMPNCYTGIFKHLVWVKPPWCNQIKNNNQTIYIGKCKESQTIRLECRENYFIAEGLFKLYQDLENVRTITLDCFTVGSHSLDEKESNLKFSLKNSVNAPVVLDIDLDFFSTQNPFLQLYIEAGLYLHLKDLFEFAPPKTYSNEHILEAQEMRICQLGELEKLFNHLNEFKRMPDLCGNEPSPAFLKVGALVKTLCEYYPVTSIQWDLVFSAGCTIDDHELPHHVSTPAELELMFRSFEEFLDGFSAAPVIITISRSSSDDYTPADQVESIQNRVLGILSEKFLCDAPILSYLDDDDEMSAPEELSSEKKLTDINIVSSTDSVTS